MWPFHSKLPGDDDVQVLHAQALSLAQSYGHDYIGVEHLFLAFRQLPQDRIIWAVLRGFDVNLEAFFTELKRKARVPIGRAAPTTLPFTPRLQGIVRAADRMARHEHATHISPLHLLAAIIYERHSIPATLLAAAYQRSHSEIPYAKILADTLLHRLLFPGYKEPK